jgi:hypothetical protein
MLIFTICHPNELANAHVLGDFVVEQGYQFVIGLIGNKKIESKFEIFELHKIVKNFDELAAKFDTSELKANLKPSFFKYLLASPKSSQKELTFLYFDCNSLIFNSLEIIKKEFNENEILIFPQISTPNLHPDEKQVLNTGIFESDFIGLKQGEESTKFLDWWEANCHKKGFRNPCKGLNEDQLWLELVPSLFEKWKIVKGSNPSVSTINNKSLKKYKSLNSPIEFGLPMPKDKTIQRKIARPFRLIAEQIDVFFDRF